MEIKEKIQKDYIDYFKSKNQKGTSALKMLKAKITEAEKVGNTNLSNDEVLNVIIKSIKQREESASIFISNNRLDLFEIENDEISILKQYLPEQMSESELYKQLLNILMDLKTTSQSLNEKAMTGKAIGVFNSKFKGLADINNVKTLVSQIYSTITQENENHG